jgi:hypothetical protein
MKLGDEIYGDVQNFHKYYQIHHDTKCWIWQPTVFRMRCGDSTHNPRRLALQLEGYVIPMRQNLTTLCGNKRCVNPEHIRLKGSGLPVQMGETLYFDEMRLFQYSNTNNANRFCVTEREAKLARERTIKLIYDILASPLTPAKYAHKNKIPLSYVKDALKVTPDEFAEIQIDKNEYSDQPKVNPRIDNYKLKIKVDEDPLAKLKKKFGL